MKCDQCVHYYNTDIGACDVCQSIGDHAMFEQISAEFQADLDAYETEMEQQLRDHIDHYSEEHIPFV